MTENIMITSRRATFLILCTSLLFASASATTGALAASHEPVEAASAVAPPAPPRETLVSEVGPAQISIDTSGSVVPVGGEFRFAATVTSSAPLEYLQLRLRVFSPDQRLMYQKTLVAPDARPGTFEYARTTADLGLSPGVYPVELSLRLSSAGEVSVSDIPLSLLVYDKNAAPVHLAAVARVSAQPLTEANGQFAFDPGQFTRARDDVASLAEYVLDSPDARLGLAISPVMLEEWQRIAAGYTFAGAEGELSVTAEEPVPRAYAAALDSLKRAVATGRLEVLTQGFSDPDLAELDAAGMADDIALQYARGSATLAATLEATASAGTAPALGRLTDEALPLLADAGTTFVLADPDGVFGDNDKPAGPGIFRAEAASMTVATTDSRLARSIAASETAGIRESIFARYVSKSATSTALTVVDLGPGGTSAERLAAVLRSIGSAPWLELTTPTQAASSPAAKQVTLIATKAGDAPERYWSTVAEARKAADALLFSLGSTNPDAEKAVRDSLIAQGSAWAGPDGSWAPAEKGLDFATWTTRAAEGVFSQVSLSAKPVTLAGDSGRVPITAINGTGSPLRFTLVLEPGRAMSLGVPPSREVTLEPGENYIEVPARLLNVLSSTLVVNLKAADIEVASTSVTLSASYLDKIVMIVGIALALIVLLVYIIRRVRAAEQAGTCASDEELRPLCPADALQPDPDNADDAPSNEESYTESCR